MEGGSNHNGRKEPGEAREAHQAIQIWEVNNALVDSMKQRIKEMPRLLLRSAAHSSCCIFRVPHSLAEINKKAYHPHIVSIGPYHHGEKHLEMIEEHKWRYLGSLLSRTQKLGTRLEDYLEAIGRMEGMARKCYSENIGLESDKFVEMLVLDGCFIIELFRKIGALVPVDPNDPIFTMQWVFPFIMRDLLKLENQIPFFVLQRLFNLSNDPVQGNSSSLVMLTLEFFGHAHSMKIPTQAIERHNKGLVTNIAHLLELFRSSFVVTEEPKKRTNSLPRMIQCATKLRQAGIKFKLAKVDSFLDIKFGQGGVIEIPRVAIDDFTSSVLLNCIVLEQCHGNGPTHMNTYAAFLSSIIKTQRDVGLLQDDDILENYIGTDEEVAHFLNNMGKDIAFDIESCYLSTLFQDVNEYYKNTWHVHWASFRHTYFDTPWSLLSAVAALILLLLTVVQAFFAVLAYIRPPK